MKMPDQQYTYDVIIVGGSYAGLSAAMSLGRSVRKTLVIDSGLPCNRFTPASHNFLTHDGQSPSQIAALARAQVEAYDTVSFLHGSAVSGTREDNGFCIEVDNGSRYYAGQLIFSTGIVDQLPGIPGFRECWGKSVIHCPYCHGYEYRGQKTGIWADGDQAFHLAPLISNLTSDLFVFMGGKNPLNIEQLEKFQQHQVRVITSEISVITHEDGQVRSVQLMDGSEVALDVLYAGIPFVQSCEIPANLGCEFTDTGHIMVDNMQKTTVPEIYACGDCTTPIRSVASAVAAGNFAGAIANMELSKAKFST